MMFSEMVHLKSKLTLTIQCNTRSDPSSEINQLDQITHLILAIIGATPFMDERALFAFHHETERLLRPVPICQIVAWAIVRDCIIPQP